MRLDPSSLRVRGSVTVMTPAEWDLRDAERGPFRLRLHVKSPTPAYRAYFKKIASSGDAATALAADRVGGAQALKAHAKLIKKAIRNQEKSRSRQQATVDMVRTELVESAHQVFGGEEVAVTDDELEYLFALPASDAESWPHAANAAAGYEPEDISPLDQEAGEQLLAVLERQGEPLAEALSRFVQHHAARAQSQKSARLEEEIIRPLASIAGSGHGSRPVEITTDSMPAPDGMTAAGAAGSAKKSGSRATAAPAREAIG